jgi:hypothetical protein
MPEDRFANDPNHFYRKAMSDAVEMHSAQFLAQMINERDWEKQRRPYYNLWPSIVPMLTRLDLDLDSALINNSRRCRIAWKMGGEWVVFS